MSDYVLFSVDIQRMLLELKMKNNREVTLNGVNRIFSPIGVQVEKSDMGYYHAEVKGEDVQGKTLVEVAQEIVSRINGS